MHHYESPHNPADLNVIGLGVNGAGTINAALAYTNAKSVVGLEKHSLPAMVNSSPTANSQSDHRGRMESNFDEPTTIKFNEIGGMVAAYAERHQHIKGLAERIDEILLAVGDTEVKQLQERYAWAKNIFPELQLLDAAGIAKRVPNVMKGRDPHQSVAAIYSNAGFVVNYAKLTETLLDEARQIPGKTLDTRLNADVEKIEELSGLYRTTYRNTETGQRHEVYSKAVVVAAGAHSLSFAQAMGYADYYALLCVVGNFFFTPDVIDCKVYTWQNPKIPFAATHGDYDIVARGRTRWGPTTVPVALLERSDYRTIPDYFGTIKHPISTAAGLREVLSDKEIRSFLWRQRKYIGPNKVRNFLPEIQKIIPSMSERDVVPAMTDEKRPYGGIRPQILDLRTKKLRHGAVKIHEGKIIFDVSASPGATGSIYNGMENVQRLSEQPGLEQIFAFDETHFRRDHTPSI